MSPISSRNLLRHELIGLRAGVVRSKNSTHHVIDGPIVDESLKTLVINQNGESKRVPKKDATFILKLSSGPVEVEGAVLYGRPKDRIKKKVKRRW